MLRIPKGETKKFEQIFPQALIKELGVTGRELVGREFLRPFWKGERIRLRCLRSTLLGTGSRVIWPGYLLPHRAGMRWFNWLTTVHGLYKRRGKPR